MLGCFRGYLHLVPYSPRPEARGTLGLAAKWAEPQEVILSSILLQTLCGPSASSLESASLPSHRRL